MKQLFTCLLIFLFAGFIQAQEKQPCKVYEKLKFSTGPHPTVVPIFPGCESLENNNDSLNQCARSYIANKIADKLDMKFNDDESESSDAHYETIVIIDVSANGDLKMKTKEKPSNPFEYLLIEKLEEISIETGKVSPAKTENNYCLAYKYRLPLKFTEEIHDITSP